MVIGKCTDVFRGIFSVWGEGVTWDDLSNENLSWGERISMKEVQDFLYSLKNEKNKYKKVVPLDVRSSFKT